MLTFAPLSLFTRNMKKILLSIAVAVLGTVAASAQFGINAGYSNVNENYSLNGTSDDESINHVFVGANYTFSLDKFCQGLGFETGLSVYYGKKTYDETLYTEKYTNSFLSLPVLLEYTIQIGNFEVNPFGGFEFTYGLNSKSKITGNGTGASYTTDWYEDTYKRLEVSAEIGLGFKLIDNIYLFADYQKGLINTSKQDGMEAGTSTFEAGLQYYF